MKAKTKLKLAKYFFLGGFYFWAAETILFIILYGWHWNAYNDIESRCDQLAFYLMLIGASFFFSLVINVVKLYVNLTEFKQVTINQDEQPPVVPL